MTDAVKRLGHKKSNHWTRAVLDAKLVTLMKSLINMLSTLQDGHEKLSRPALREKVSRLVSKVCGAAFDALLTSACLL